MPITPRDPRDKMEPRKPMPTLPGRPRKPGPRRPMPKLPGRPRPDLIKGLTPEQIKRLKELMKKRKGLDPKNPKFKKSIDSLKEQMKKTGPRPKGRKKLMGGGSASSREAMMHGFYNKDMGMGKKKK